MLDSCGDLRYRRGAHRRRIRAGFLRKVTFDNMPGTGPLGYPALLSSPLFTNVVEEVFSEVRAFGAFPEVRRRSQRPRAAKDAPSGRCPAPTGGLQCMPVT